MTGSDTSSSSTPHSQNHSTGTGTGVASPASEDPITRSISTGKLPSTTNTKNPSTPSDPGNLLSTTTAPFSAPSPSASSTTTDDGSEPQHSAFTTTDILTFSPPSPHSSALNPLLRQLHPYSSTLSLADLDSCAALEAACFSPAHAASRDKLAYRLRSASELCLGLFASVARGEDAGVLRGAPTLQPARVTETADPSRRGVLLAHLIATKTTNELVSDADMAIPSSTSTSTPSGHHPAGRTLALHSLAVLPTLQNHSLGRTLLKAYIQRMVDSGTADRIALLTYARLKPWYMMLGFEDRGRSQVAFGGEEWWDMVLEFGEGEGTEGE